MRLRLLLVVFALTSTCQASTRIGEVLKLTGDWCRDAIHVSVGNPVYLEDDIRYCSDPFTTSHYIMIRVDGNTPYDRSYLCTTPGICDKKEKLWLAGAYYYQRLRSPGGAPVQSSPKLIGKWFFPDLIIEQGQSLQGIPADRGVKTIQGIHGIYGKHQDPSVQRYDYCTFTNGKTDHCSSDLRYISNVDVYGVFINGNRTTPIALVGIVPRNSTATSDWDLVPDVYKEDTSPQTIVERRAYLVELVKSAKH
jgi:hypothetical protein